MKDPQRPTFKDPFRRWLPFCFTYSYAKQSGGEPLLCRASRNDVAVESAQKIPNIDNHTE
jgi:hypothetical protein